MANPEDDDKQSVLVNPNSDEARQLAMVIMTSLDKVVPFNVQMAAIVRLFSSSILLAIESAPETDKERVRGQILQLLNEITDAASKWPNVPAHMITRKGEPGKLPN